MEYILKIWLYLGAVVAGAVGFYIFGNWKKHPASKKIIGIFILVLVAHTLEERVVPGGYHYIFNIANGGMFVMNQMGVMVCNVTVIAVFVYLLWKWSDKTQVLLVVALMGIVELILHTVMAVMSYNLFRDAGLAIPYCPGMFTSVFGFVPLSVYTLAHIRKNKLLSKENCNRAKTIGIAVAILMGIVWGTILLPQLIFANSTYLLPDNGFYIPFLGK